jgi:hypothetical protein
MAVASRKLSSQHLPMETYEKHRLVRFMIDVSAQEKQDKKQEC